MPHPAFPKTLPEFGGPPLAQAYLDEIVFRHSRRKQPIAAIQTLLGLGTKHKSMTYKDMRGKWTVPRRQAKDDHKILWLAETTG